MSVYSEYQLHKNLLVNAVADAVSRPIFAQDFKTSLLSIFTNAASNFTIDVLASNQELPPDPTLAASASNQYTLLGYTDQQDQAYYAGGSPFNPSTVPDRGARTFNIETTGARWLFIRISGYTAGVLSSCQVELFSNFN